MTLYRGKIVTAGFRFREAGIGGLFGEVDHDRIVLVGPSNAPIAIEAFKVIERVYAADIRLETMFIIESTVIGKNRRARTNAQGIAADLKPFIGWPMMLHLQPTDSDFEFGYGATNPIGAKLRGVFADNNIYPGYGYPSLNVTTQTTGWHCPVSLVYPREVRLRAKDITIRDGALVDPQETDRLTDEQAQLYEIGNNDLVASDDTTYPRTTVGDTVLFPHVYILTHPGRTDSDGFVQPSIPSLNIRATEGSLRVVSGAVSSQSANVEILSFQNVGSLRSPLDRAETVFPAQNQVRARVHGLMQPEAYTFGQCILEGREYFIERMRAVGPEEHIMTATLDVA